MITKSIRSFLADGLLCCGIAAALTACSDDFLAEKRNYDNVNADIYDYVEGCEGRLNDIYAWCLPTVGDVTGTINRNFPVSMGNADLCARATEEYAGFSDFVNPEIELSSMSGTNGVPDFFTGQTQNIQASVYGRIRNINDCINGIEGSSLPAEQKEPLLGQAYFFRAWAYFNLFRWYGGVPLVTEVLEPVEGNYTPRSSARATMQFILADLDRAARLLAENTMGGGWNGSNWGRVTTGTALALKGRVLLWWASPLFNRANDQARWATAYQLMKQELDSINACGYGLFATGSNVNGSDFALQFLQAGQNPEAVFVTLYNNIEGDGLDNQRNNRWERDIRPANTGGGGKGAGLMLIQQFPMADGRIPAGMGTYTKLETSQYAYDAEAPFMDRDPRFYRTFAFPGFRWAYNGNASQANPNNPSDGKNYVLWNYVWYTELSEAGDPTNGKSYGADNLLTSKTNIYVRKKSDDLDVNASPLYQYVALDSKGSAPFYSAAPLIELRYAEVLLNVAEAACMAGDMSYAVEQLKRIRARAGYTAENNFGLQANLVSDQAACMSAILYERQIEFAYEGKRFDDLRRWMLFDGGSQLPDGAPSTWQLTGWGGNTCTWLGFKPLNGQRRESIEFRTADKFGVGGTTYESDPIIAYYKTSVTDSLKALVKERHADDPKWTTDSINKFIAATYDLTAETVRRYRSLSVNFKEADIVTQLQALKAWYQDNLVVTEKRGDGYDSQKNLLYMNYRPKYYILGLSSGAQSSNKAIPQTIGWQDYNTGGANGTFDPLAD